MKPMKRALERAFGAHRFALRGASALGVLLASVSCDDVDSHAVSGTQDGGSGSLRAAVDAVNRERIRPARIEVPAGTYTLTRCSADELNQGGDLDLNAGAPVTIVAMGGPVTIRQTCPNERVLDSLGSGALTLIGVTLTGGSVTSTDPELPAAGGGLRAAGDVTLEDVTVTGNSVTGAPGEAVASGSPLAGGAAQGGGVYVAGTLRASYSSIVANTATGGAGGVGTTATPIPSAGGEGEGGGVFAAGAVTFTGGRIAENRVIGGLGGAGFTAAPGSGAVTSDGAGGLARGGGLAQRRTSTAAVALTDTLVSANVATGGACPGGALEIGATVPSSGDGAGGGIATSGALTATRVVARQNQAVGGKPVADMSYAAPGAARGGAIAADGSARLEACTLSENRAVSGAAWQITYSYACQTAGVRPAPAWGGGVYSEGGLTITGGSYAENTSSHGGGWRPAGADAGQGGAVFGVDVSATGATFTKNTATARGGAIAATRLTANELTATENTAGGTGGGALSALSDATLTRCTIARNAVKAELSEGSGGGGVMIGGKLTITDSSVTENSGSNFYQFTRGGICMSPSTYASFRFYGGGIYAGSIEAARVTVANNSLSTAGYASGSSTVVPEGTGGGGIAVFASASLVNTTVSANRVIVTLPPSLFGSPGPWAPVRAAGVLAGSITLDHVTLADNQGDATLDTSELRARRSAAIAGAGQTVCKRAATQSSYNVFADASCALRGAGDLQSETTLLLGPLASNGGPIPTRLPGLASVLVDHIPTGACSQPTDARGVTRPRGAGCDVGAVEVQPGPTTASTDLKLAFVNSPPSVSPGLPATWRLTVSNAGPNLAQPSVAIDVPQGVNVSSVSALGAACTTISPITCVWSAALQSGAASVITIAATVDAAALGNLSWRAQVYAPNLSAPLEDDTAALVTPISATLDLQLQTRFERDGYKSLVTVDLVNAGPASVVATAQDPVELVFRPSAGIQAVSRVTLRAPGSVLGEGTTAGRFAGTFTPAETPFASVTFEVSGGASLPVQLGTIELVNSGVTEPLTHAPIPIVAADLSVSGTRSTNTQSPGDDVQFTVQVRNNGPAPSTDINVALFSYDRNITWSEPEAVRPSSSFTDMWNIASLAPGATATLIGIAHSPTEGVFSVSVSPWNINACQDCNIERRGSSASMDLNALNDEVEIDIQTAVNGTANVQVTELTVVSGSAPDRRLVRATVRNAGPQPALDTTVEVGAWLGLGSIGTATGPAGWTCHSTGCSADAPVPAGASAQFEFEVQFTSDPAFPGNVSVSVNSYGTPDPDNGDNRRVLTVAP